MFHTSVTNLNSRARMANIWPGILLWCAAVVLTLTAGLAHAQAEQERHLVSKPGATVTVDSEPCVKNVRIVSPGTVMTPTVNSPTTRTLVIFSSTPEQRDPKTFTAEVGQRETADGKGCEASSVRQYTVAFDTAPTVSSKALESSFQILVAAFLLALLLESAFALLFNWRIFEVLFVGKAVRTPIMLVGAWLVVYKFDFDLMAALLDAYDPSTAARQGNWFTILLTAMILAGGSVGVNRILVALNFRSLTKDEEKPRKLNNQDAWVSVEVEPIRRKDKVRIDLTEITPPAGVVFPTTVGVAGSQKPTLRGMLLGDNYRVPRSGGMQVDTAKFYTITLLDLTNGGVYDVTGEKLTAENTATIFKFGPRAFLDFHVKLVE